MHAMRTEQEWVERIGRRVEARRLELGYESIKDAAEDVGLSDSTWGPVERGYRKLTADVRVLPNPQKKVTWRMARALQWEPDWLDRLKAGEDPAEADWADDDKHPSAESITTLKQLMDEVVDLAAQVDELRRRLPGS